MRILFFKKISRNLLGILISFLCLAFIFSKINLKEIYIAIEQFHWSFLILGAFSILFGYSIRIIRWATLLRAAGAQIQNKQCVAPFLGSIALNNVLPMRLGDAIRAFIFPTSMGVGRIIATGSLVIERLIDLGTLLIVVILGILFESTIHLPMWLSHTILSLTIFVVISMCLVFLCSSKLAFWSAKFKTYHRFFGVISDLLITFQSMSRFHVLLIVFSLSLLVWIGESGIYWSLLSGFNLKSGPFIALTVMGIATLATLIPSSPGYIGPFHLAAYTAVSMLGGTPSQAASFAVLSHLTLWLLTTFIGSLALLLNPKLFSSVFQKNN